MFYLVSTTICFLEHFYSVCIAVLTPVSPYRPDTSSLTIVAFCTACIYMLCLYHLHALSPSFVYMPCSLFCMLLHECYFVSANSEYTPREILCSKILPCVATLFYLTALSNNFPSVRLSNGTTTCDEQRVYLMWRVCELKETINSVICKLTACSILNWHARTPTHCWLQ